MQQHLQRHLEHLHFPNESTSYRQARNALLEKEMELRRHIVRVAQQRRALLKGGELPEDYVFEGRCPSGRTSRRRAVAISIRRPTIAKRRFDTPTSP